MLTVLSCIAYEHDTALTVLAVILLLCGAVLTMRLYARVRHSEGPLKLLWLFLSGLIGGGTIWSTHFVAMIAYESPLILGYDLGLTLLTLVIAVAGATAGLYVSSLTRDSWMIELGGALFGASIVIMHFIGTQAMRVSGVVTVSSSYVVVAVALALVFGSLATNRVARPSSQYSVYAAAGSFAMAVFSLHFVAMAGASFLPLRLEEGWGAGLASSQQVGIAVSFTVAVLFFSALLTHVIDSLSVKEADSRLTHMAHHDPLTGLPNRRGLEKWLGAFLFKAAAGNARTVAVVCNLRRFKDINEALGRAGGDALLRHVIKHLSEGLQADEFLARTNGDEFVIIGKPVYSSTYISDLCRRIKALVAEPLDWHTGRIEAGCCIGYACSPDHAASEVKLLEAAELALRRAKALEGEEAVCFDPDLDGQTRNRSALALELSCALRNGQFQLYYQLQNDASTRQIVGAEALLRWNHPARGMVEPLDFIPIAEETGFIRELGAWVARTACLEAASWPKAMRVAINVSPVQLADSQFPQIIAAVLAESGLEPHRLELEITETGIVAQASRAAQILGDLRHLGVRIVMDDFGTGYSSLATLQAHDFDKIKIDREFVRHLESNRQSDAIVKATLALGVSLGVPVLAEGVETEYQLNFLKVGGCSEVQGFLFGLPMPAAEIAKILHQTTLAPAESASDPLFSVVPLPAGTVQGPVQSGRAGVS